MGAADGEPGIFDSARTAEVLGALARTHTLTPSPDGRRIVAYGDAGRPALEIQPPPLLPIPPGTWDLEAYREAARRPEGRVLLLLLQAGACALGLWEDGVLVRHKVIRRYVVRGTGRAQTTYLKTRGKSRYGSRLRLRNASLLLCESAAKMRAWWEENGPFGRVFASCPVRLWPELFGADPPPPFPQRGFAERVPLAVRVPCFEELRRVRWHLSHGRVTSIKGQGTGDRG
jgi:hypothetical protein